MSITRTTCPGCGAGLKSPTGFNPGQAIRCPKCSTAFTVPADAGFEEVADDDPAPKRKGPPAKAARAGDDDDRPRRRRPRDDDEDDYDDEDDRPRKKGKKKGGYKNSPLRYAVLGVLLVVMGVLAFMLYQKKMKEREDAAADPAGGEDIAPEFKMPAARPNQTPNPGPRPGPRPGPVPGGDGVPQPQPDDFRPTGNGPTGAGMSRAVNDMKMVLLAMHNHHDTKGSFPAAAITAPDGRPLLSWRVAILPYLEQDQLYKQFKLTEPWDSPANKALVAQMPRTYQGTLPTNDGKTSFKVFVGGGALFDLRRGKRMQEVSDGTSNTLAVVESGRPIEWTRPDDIPFDGKTAPQLVPPTGGSIVIAATADGFVRRLNLTNNPPATILKAVTASGGEIVELE